MNGWDWFVIGNAIFWVIFAVAVACYFEAGNDSPLK